MAHPAVQRNRTVEGVDEALTQSAGYRISLIVRRRIEEIFGWVQTTGGLRKSRYRGVARTNLCAQLVASTYNLVRMAKLTVGSPPPTTVGA
jgi:hypothetical protein